MNSRPYILVIMIVIDFGYILNTLLPVRRELGRLREHGRIQIAELPAALAHERGNVPQQRNAVRALVARVGIWKMLADVTERERAEQGIHDGMREHIRVRVTVQTKLKRNVHTADDARSAGDQSVYVVTVSDAHITCPPL